jgi:hypothetical protein
MWNSLREWAEKERLDKVDLPEADLPSDVLLALPGIKEKAGRYGPNEGD